MTAAETLRAAWAGVAANALRSGLTVLGMAIGVAAVIILVAVGNGSKRQVQAGIQALGTNVLLVQAGGLRGGPGAFGGGAASGFTLSRADAAALQDPFDAPDVRSASPVVAAGGTTLVAGSVSYAPGSLVGTTPSYAQARDLDIADGAMFTAADVARHRHVVVLGPTAAENLFPAGDALGQAVRIGGSAFTVIGVTAPKGSNGVADQDDVALAPLTAIQDAVSGYGAIDSITVQARSQGALSAAQAEVNSILTQRHHLTGDDAADPPFRVINQGAILATSDQATRVFTTLLGVVAAISLLVGGIGVMNIMLVSVTERTREIGIRKAVGARRGDILAQFLAEAVLVSTAGGLVGMAAGIAGSRFEIAGVSPAVALYSVPLAFGAAVASGLFFGTYPAARAASLRPIDALRFE